MLLRYCWTITEVELQFVVFLDLPSDFSAHGGGGQYAREAIAAMKADRNGSLIALVIQDVIKDAVDRSAKKAAAY